MCYMKRGDDHFNEAIHSMLSQEIFRQCKERDVKPAYSTFRWNGSNGWSACRAYLVEHKYLTAMNDASPHKEKNYKGFFRHCLSTAGAQLVDEKKEAEEAPKRSEFGTELEAAGADLICSQDAEDLSIKYVKRVRDGSHMSVSLCGEVEPGANIWAHFDSNKPSQIGMSNSDFDASTVEATQAGVDALQRSAGNDNLIIYAQKDVIISGVDVLSASRVEDYTIRQASGKRKRSSSPSKVYIDQQIGRHLGPMNLKGAVKLDLEKKDVLRRSVVTLRTQEDWVGAPYEPDALVSPYVMECQYCENTCEYFNSKWNVCNDKKCQDLVRSFLFI